MTVAERIPRHDADVERACLASAFLSPDAALVLPAPDDFFLPSHQKLARVLREMTAADQPIDIVTVAGKLGGERREVDAYLYGIIQAVPTSANAEHYAEIIKRLATLRRLYNAARSIEGFAYDTDDPTEALAKTEALLADVPATATKEASLGDALRTVYDSLHLASDYLAPKDFPAAHFHAGDLVILAARPGIGKSSMAGQWAEWWGINKRVKVYSCEMSIAAWAKRYVMSRTPYTHNDLDDGRVDRSVVENATADLLDKTVILCDSRGWSSADITLDARRFARSGGHVIIVDHFGKTVPRGRASRWERARDASQSYATLAGTAGLVVVVLSQISREVKRDDGTLRPPTSADLRETGALDEDADAICLLHRYEPGKALDAAVSHFASKGYDVDDPMRRDFAQIQFDKLRNGKRFVAPLWWSGEDVTFARVEKLVRSVNIEDLGRAL
jgi:replicative DNA helicase